MAASPLLRGEHNRESESIGCEAGRERRERERETKQRMRWREMGARVGITGVCQWSETKTRQER